MSDATLPTAEAAAAGLDEARAAIAAGRSEVADAAFARVLETRPADLEALTWLFERGLLAGAPAPVRARLERAAAADPARPEILEMLGVCQVRQRDWDGARASLLAALRRAPRMPVARLFAGAVLEAQGEERRALKAYLDAIALAQKSGRWTGPATTPAWLMPRLAHALEFARRVPRRIVDAALAPLRPAGGGDLPRVDACVAMRLGEQPLERPDPRQRPNALFVPGLPATPYVDRARLPWLAALEAATPVIADELRGVLGSEGFRPFLNFTAEDQVGRHLQGDGRHRPAWDAFFFYRHGERVAENAARCPRTAALLETLPLVRIRRHAPEICFSVLSPGTHILPHTGDTNARIVVHLPLIVPERCALRVGGIEHAWVPGQCVAFDDTFEHEAWNRSGEPRVVLILDAWNPDLDEREQAALAELSATLGELAAEAPFEA